MPSLSALCDEPRPGAPRTVEDERIEALVTATLESVPKNATHWSSRGMARASGLSVSTVQRIWRAFGLRPHRLETFKLSTDRDFVAKVREVVGLYMTPPDRALVLCVDEKSQLLAPERCQPLLPMRPGQAARRTRDDTRHLRRTKCFADAAEFRRFLDLIEEAVPPGRDVHLVMDN